MKIVVDTNVIISALIKESSTRKIVTNIEFELFTPSFSLNEIQKYKQHICEKALMSKGDFDILLKIIFENIEIVPFEFYKIHIKEAKNLIKDVKDVDFLACAIALNADIWSDDKHFQEQKIVKIFTTKEFARIFLKK